MLTSREPTASVSVNTSATTFEIRENIRVYDGYDSGRIFTSHSKSVKEVHGVTTVVLDISLSTDKSQKNQTGSRVGKPLTMLISNCTGKNIFHILRLLILNHHNIQRCGIPAHTVGTFAFSGKFSLHRSPTARVFNWPRVSFS